MVDWHDPDVELQCAHTALYLVHVSTGWYLWEYLVSISFDWEHIVRRRSFRWTLIPYFVTRYTCLAAILASMRVSNVVSPIMTCSTWWQVIDGTAHTAVAFASLLLALRVIAISGNNRLLCVFLGATWLAEVGTLLHGAIMIRSAYVSELSACGVTRSVDARANYVATLVFDTACLVIAFALLLRARGAGVWKFLVSQGVMYLAVSIVAYVPATILLMLNLNDGMNEGLQPVGLVSLVICATRMYRDLLDFDTQNSTADTFTMTATTSLGWRRPSTLAVPCTFVGASLSDEESRDGPTIVSPSASRAKITMFDDGSYTTFDQLRDRVSNKSPRSECVGEV